MDIHYNAFISYRHHPDDIRVAKEVHQALERFKIPKAIRKKANFKGPMRLFRDKEELPITSNLNDDIGDALRNADFLIVICSVHTKESIWVQREIELFLKSHDRNHVLTVLASGEPYDVIPEILLYNDVVDPVTGEVTRELVEPLSCDWRIGRRKAKREELPRLAAPLLGCAYDELRQRQRQYRMRRLITFFSIALVAALGLAAYFLQTSITIARQNVEIQKNLEQSQRNQSKHLATASQERLAEGDRLTAISLATAALPDETGNRPYVAEAEYALTEALGVYQENLRTLAAGAVSPGSQAVLTDFWVNSSGTMLYLKDMRNHITVWDAATTEKLGEWDHSEELLRKLIPVQNDLALVKHTTERYDALRCVKPDGTQVWQVTNCVDVAVTEDGKTALVIVQKETSDYELLLLEATTGNPIRESVDLDLFSGLMNPWEFYPYAISEGMPILIEYSAFPESKLCMFDWQTGACTELPPELTDYPTAALTADRKLVAMSHAETDAFSGTFGENRINSHMRRDVVCYDLGDGSLLWESVLESSSATNGSVHELPDGRILCQSGPAFQVMDASTGEIINHCEAGGSVLTLSVGEDYAHAVLKDGYLCNYWYNGTYYTYEEKCLQNPLWKAELCGSDSHDQGIFRNCFAMRLYDNQVTIYRRMMPPTLWEHDYTYAINIRDQRVHADQWLIYDGSVLHLFDLKTHQIRWTLETGAIKLLNFSQDGSEIWLADGECNLQIVDAATGKVTVKPLEEGENRAYDYISADGLLSYVVSGFTQDWEPQTLVKTLRLDTGERAIYELPALTQEEESIFYGIAGQWGQYLWLLDSTGKFLELDLTTGQYRVLKEEMTALPAVSVKEDGTSVAVTDLEQVLLLTPGAEGMKTISMEEDTLAGSVYFHGEDLLVICDDGNLYHYDTAGNLLSRTELDVGDTFSQGVLNVAEATQANISWTVTPDQKLVVNAFGQGNVIDCESWKVSASVPGYQLYREADNSFVCNGASGIAGYPAYSLTDLLQLAQEKLGNYELTQEQKAGYGLE